MDLVAVHHSEQKLNAPQAFKHCKFLFFVFTQVWNDPSGACVLHPMETNFLGVHGRAWARMDGFSHATESGESGPPVTVRPSTRAVMEG